MSKTSEVVALMEDQPKIEAEMLRGQVEQAQLLLESTQARLEEGMSSLSLMIDNIGWQELGQYGEEGPNLREVHTASSQIRELSALNAHMKRGLTLRQSYILQGGIKYGKIPENTDGRRRGEVNVKALIDDPVNQKNYFCEAAAYRREGTFYTSGQSLYYGEDAKPASNGMPESPKRIYPMPIWQLSNVYVNPNDPSDVWAIRRSWNENNGQTAGGTPRVEWIYTDTYLRSHNEQRPQSIEVNGKREPVAQDKRLFWASVNRQEGWVLGLPDALAAMQWARQYRELVMSGKKMTDAMSTIAFKLSGKTARGTNNAAARMASTTEKGGTAALIDGMDLTALASAGKAYEFDKLRPVLAIMATALEISVVALSSDPGAAGSSYGSAATLDMPTKLAMLARRNVHIDLTKDILRWFGWSEPVVFFEMLEDGAELYRQVQALLLPYLQGLYSPDEMRSIVDQFMGWPAGSVPEGVLIPANRDSLPRKDIDTDGMGAAQTPSATQGRANGVGGDGSNSGNDIRQDGIS